MVWVRSEYAGELAVVSAWLAALIPWNLTYASIPGYGTILYLRYPFLEVQYLVGWTIDDRSFFLHSIPAALRNQAGQVVADAYLAWAAGSTLIAVAVLTAIAYYLAEERVENGPVDPVRLIGGLLLAAGIVLLAATYLLVTLGVPGIPLPVGTLLLGALGAILLLADRREDAVDETEYRADHAE
ncbi:hypothetical protein SAMN05192561_101733 [Halopenitus malekzadehii]|uniref:TIGR04206 family protein n=1 Tax=Halopenitus malekzadehii TaxID=1267564 RepID=A0A1H6HY97_9EURY|nr:hypothetical protein [Halopenitus malekzadehii]SEH41092.1 hypothetical protein SAMN05192561_101733 [Halopenitus malekzadehii]